ncbi:glutathione S-transferase family protein [Candidimonas nitroreducens]|uniref:Glutathione S-transferase n=1 Tax=Candidimonas nitroreducens TaxID=683354 RepID=A0A225LX04_9BURK|nr:glutathione S-transferase family protein [Candidimonas nitroreducens]OWT53758.1 glutathione S-transferase [Candidimonas nitroreducens]
MKLHWSPRSPFVRKVMIVLHETGQAEAVNLVRTPVAMSEPNLDLVPDNPLIKLPTLVLDDGYALYDSRVICEYLAQRVSSPIFPADLDRRIRALRQQALGDGFLDALLLFRQERNKPREKQTQAWLDAFALKTDAVLANLDKSFAAQTPREFDIGAISIGCALSYLDYRFPDLDWRARAPAAAGWHGQAFMPRPSVVKTEPTQEP